VTRDAAVARILQGLSFRRGTSLNDVIVACLKEAQRNLERGKTLPRFLLLEDQTLSLVSGASTVAKPASFHRSYDEDPIHYTPPDTDKPFFLQEKRNLMDARQANIKTPNDPAGPKVYVIRGSVIYFITVADRTYSLTWSYYKWGTVLSAGSTENEWLNETSGAPEWLIGEAGVRVASDLNDVPAATKFTSMRELGRSACLGDDVANEEASEGLYLGSDL
jgi:hypothetical protein